MSFIRSRGCVPDRSVRAIVISFVLVAFAFGSPAWAQQRPTTAPKRASSSANASQNPQQQTGSVTGQVVDPSGTQVVGATVSLKQTGSDAPKPDVMTDEDGRFVFTGVAAGDFDLTISFPGLTPQKSSGTVAAGQHFVTPLIVMVIPTQVTEIHVGVPPEELATEQIHEQEHQRVLGVIPNFYVSYAPNAAPLKAKHKFQLAWKSASDPITFAGVAFFAGVDQAADRYGAYGQGAQGYAKRFGATYGDVFTATFIGGAVMPSLLKQDPRYFYKGTGSKKSRLLYAIASSVICKGDNGKWQPNYSNVIGSFAGSSLQYTYTPPGDRTGTNGILGGALIRMGETSLAGVLQEFLFAKLTKTKGTQRASMTNP
jgi:Carboxypeptidase regulatory-like domain